MTTNTNETSMALPKPIALTPEQLLQIAAGTAGLLPTALLRPIIAGGIPPEPGWEGLTPVTAV